MKDQLNTEVDLLLKTIYQLHYAFAVFLEAEQPQHVRVARSQLIESIAAVCSQAPMVKHYMQKEAVCPTQSLQVN